MVRRRGLGATMAAGVVFSVLLVSGLAVYVASQNYAGLASEAYGENYLRAEYSVLMAAAGTDILADVQQFVASTPLPCGSPMYPIDGHLGMLVDSQEAPGISIDASVRPSEGTEGDNLTTLGAFAGSVPGELDMALRFVAQGVAGPDVVFNRTEVHAARLPVEIAAATSLCLDSFGSIEGTLTHFSAPNCTSAWLGPVILGAARAPSANDSSLILHYSYAIEGSDSCSVTIRVSVTEPGIPGPGGRFSALFEEEGSVLVPARV